jgi:hypothetical protein
MKTVRQLFQRLLAVALLLSVSYVYAAGEDEEAEQHFQKRMAWVQKHEAEAIANLSDPTWVEGHPKGTFYAFKYLTGVRSVRAVPVFCKLLLYQEKVTESRSGRLFIETAPAYSALLAVGKPAVEGLLFKIGTSETSGQYRDVAGHLLAGLLGKDQVLPAVQRFRKEAAIHSRSANPQEHRLYKNYDPARIALFEKEVKSPDWLKVPIRRK